jgi:phosphatidylserine decarboxylase
MSDLKPRWYHRLHVGMQYLLPQHLLSALMYRITRLRWRPLKDLIIRLFVRHFGVDMSEALEAEPTAFGSFNEFFTRELRPGARPPPPEQDAVLCPADGTLSQLGGIEGGRIFQAKGHDYSLLDLLGGREDWAASFAGGRFATIYLSPRDYHRVHMPAGGTLREMIHIPGRLFSVNPVTTSLVPRLFARNERVVCLFEGDAGPMAVILVGAIFVGSMETVWAGQITPTGHESPSRRYDADSAIQIARGDEMGRFNMGSTVVLLFPPRRVAWDPSLEPGATVRVRQAIGRLTAALGGAPET